MILLLKKTGKSVRLIRNSIEVTVLGIGYVLGGPVGVGTAIISFGLGYVMQFVFNIFKFNPKEVVHRELSDEINAVKSLLKKSS